MVLGVARGSVPVDSTARPTLGVGMHVHTNLLRRGRFHEPPLIREEWPAHGRNTPPVT